MESNHKPSTVATSGETISVEIVCRDPGSEIAQTLLGSEALIQAQLDAPASAVEYHTEAAKFAKSTQADLEALRKDALAPFKVETDRISSLFGPALLFVKQLGQIARDKLAENERDVRALRAEAEAKAAVAASEGRHADTLAALRLAAVAPKTPGGVSYRKSFRAVVVDVMAVPRAYLSVDAAKLTAAAKVIDEASAKPLAIPGVVWEEVLTPVVKGGSK
jgi:hypothetical protein